MVDRETRSLRPATVRDAVWARFAAMHDDASQQIGLLLVPASAPAAGRRTVRVSFERVQRARCG
ncbi:hypothetical protein [Capillimicrobium parvum]|uniref:Uncharacterized protein n=1 Tax=Capillimicrobium parvum TaxID=2884022 RepID=A0A9E6XUQ7_9ACTN|nr:hypothetical protein [Capillimicrobium parvum]UGS34744.1 hypothetical protein DSM104329_01126 [Capillimicrobium parvum]